MAGGKITVRVGSVKHKLVAGDKIQKQVLSENMIPSPVKVSVEGMKAIALSPRKLEL